jgi:hypothetical protein
MVLLYHDTHATHQSEEEQRKNIITKACTKINTQVKEYNKDDCSINPDALKPEKQFEVRLSF